MGQLIIITKIQYVTSININNLICILLLQHWNKIYSVLLHYVQNYFHQIHFNSNNICYKCFHNINIACTCSSLIVLEPMHFQHSFALVFHPLPPNLFHSSNPTCHPHHQLQLVDQMHQLLFFKVFASKKKIKKQNKDRHQHHLIHFLALETKKTITNYIIIVQVIASLQVATKKTHKEEHMPSCKQQQTHTKQSKTCNFQKKMPMSKNSSASSLGKGDNSKETIADEASARQTIKIQKQMDDELKFVSIAPGQKSILKKKTNKLQLVGVPLEIGAH